ncbi:MAG: HAMP domain-containing sensor histidine kinase [Candidatus Omnitrophica bacterium]|nr:HAMP domain-containing sensor histidine kinase [Candidatus Omnitrophota bacterium]
MESNAFQEGLVERLSWLIRLRWIAVIGALLTVLFVRQGLKFNLPGFPLYAVILALFIYNLLFFFLLIRGKKKPLSRVNKIANSQISLDLLSLAVLIHFSGGIENPFIFYFIFHMIIASILLSRRDSFMQAAFAVSLFFLMVISEYLGVFPHYCLKKFMISCQYHNPLYLGGVAFVFVSTLFIAVYLATSISNRLRQREKVLEQANEQLKAKDRVKSEYVLHVSHDIKEHLAAIQGCLEPVAAKITGELNPKQLDLIQRASRRTEKLMLFVKALLEITRIKLSRQIKMEYFSFGATLSEAISYVSAKAKEKNITLHFVLEPTIDKIRGSKEHIQETLTNLLANSVKYTPHNGKINIVAEDKGNRILIEISDNGIGIPKAELPRIFEEFYRASNAKEVERDGTGLGLSIAKQIVEIHHGKIWVESEEGKGSIFHIELPK